MLKLWHILIYIAFTLQSIILANPLQQRESKRAANETVSENEELGSLSEDCNIEPNVDSLKRHFNQALSKPRNHLFPAYKEFTRSHIQYMFKLYGLKTRIQHFQASENKAYGQNIIGVWNKSRERTVVVVGAHYDSVQNCPGVDDNGSGIVALLELARIIGTGCIQSKHAIFFVAFDYEETGLEGSRAFTGNFLPRVVDEKNLIVVGAIIMDMVLSYNNSVGSQFLPNSFIEVNPSVSEKIKNGGYRGNYLNVWSRESHDTHMVDLLTSVFEDISKSIDLFLFNFPAPLSAFHRNMKDDFKIFLASDHSSFWYPPGEKVTYAAVLLTDGGSHRGYQNKCYHQICDDLTQLNDDNLEFLRVVIVLLRDTINQLHFKNIVSDESWFVSWSPVLIIILILFIVCACICIIVILMAFEWNSENSYLKHWILKK